MHSLMWYRSPASEWKEGLPIGNGMLAAMVLGGVEKERIALNHEWLWRANGRRRDTAACHRHLLKIRQLFFEGKALEAGELANEKLGGLGGMTRKPNRVDPYQPAGDLLLMFDHPKHGDYRRQLDLGSAIASVQYVAQDALFERQMFAHASLPVICLRQTCSRKGGLNFRLALERVEDPDCKLKASSRGDEMRLEGKFPEGSRFCILARAYPQGGDVAAVSKSAALEVKDASEVVLLLTIAVAHDDEDVTELAEKQFEDVPTEWTELASGHAMGHVELYGRVTLDLGDRRDDVPTDERLAALREGKRDNGIMALYFNFGRYLLISSSRAGGLPANLQGKWNEDLKPPWECDLHHDVNLQMNYWPAEVCGLAECTGPLFDHMERFMPHGRKMARALYNCKGVWFPIQTDPWGRATPESRGWDVWIGAAAWLAQHLWWRYEYGLDEEFLRKRAYPFFKEVAAFYETYLVRDPKHGWLVPVPSQSPENRFVGGTSPVSLCIGATMDLELIHDCLTHAIRASKVLDVDERLRHKWQKLLRSLPPLQVGRHGQLQEWLEDYEEVEPQHRHISHLFGLFPGDQITPEDAPEMEQAARRSLERRLEHGGGHTGWSRAWTVCCWARLREGDLAFDHLQHLITDFATVSLLDLHPPRIFQIDGNFGGTAGVAEMLLQSHNDLMRILPALPGQWPKGEVQGLRARGGFIVDIEWEEGKAKKVELYSALGRPCRVKVAEDAVPAVTGDAGEVKVSRPEPTVIEFPTREGQRYELNWGAGS